jgi:hypothetical protein
VDFSQALSYVLGDYSELVKEKAIHLIGNYCVGIPNISVEMAEPICRMVAQLLQNYEQYKMAILRRAVWCCANLIRRFQYAWQGPIEKYGLLQLIKDLLVRPGSDSLRHHLLYLIHQIFKSNVFFESFDTGLILDLVNDPNEKIRIGALYCVLDLVVENPVSIQEMLKKGIVEIVANCFMNNSAYQVKLKCLSVVRALLKADDQSDWKIVQELLKLGFMGALIELLQGVREQSALTMIEILTKCGAICERAGCIEQYAAHLAELDAENMFFDIYDQENTLLKENMQRLLVQLGWL